MAYVSPEPKQFFFRMIAVADRECSQCEDLVGEGTIYFKSKDCSIWCGDCVDYYNKE